MKKHNYYLISFFIKRLKLFTATTLLLTLATTTHAQTWTQQAKLVASDGAADDFLGRFSSIDGDYAIVGAQYEDTKGLNAGAAYIFVRSGTSWTQQAKLVASDGAASDNFGWSVSISGDYAIVGAQYEDDKGSNAGAAYVFVRSGTTWTQQAKLTASDGAANDYFGYSVAISGDYAIVGAYLEDDKGVNAGAAYVFVRSGTTWTQQAKLLASDGETGDVFGQSVSISGVTALIGASGDDDKGSSAGAAYVFVRSGTAWTQQAKLTASDGAASDKLAYSSVSISGDYAVAGAYGEDDKGGDAGAAYVFKRNGTSWSQQAKLTASDGAANDYFGISIAISGNYIVAGAYGEDDKGSNAGAAYFFEAPKVCLSPKAYLQGALLLSSTSTMNDDLRAASLIPSAEPYTSLSGFTHVGKGGGESAPASVFTTTGNNAIVDWVFLELRDKNTNTSVLETRSALLQRDGDIVDAANGTGNVCFTGLADPEVYVSVRHRNHLGVMINATKTLTTGGTTADFSTETLYGTNATKTVNGVSALWTGNPSGNNKVTYETAGNDADEVVNSVFADPTNNLFGGSQGHNYLNIYNTSDVNMNGNVQYEAAGNDVDPILNNILAYPGNSLFGGSQGYQNMEEQLP